MPQSREDLAWQRAFAIQAKSDLDVYEHLCGVVELPACHRLHYLQMWLEKLGKALFNHPDFSQNRPADYQTTHAVIAKVMPLAFRQWMVARERRVPPEKFKQIRLLCRELDLLAPAVDNAGRRPDNCEYPWQDVSGGERILTPAEYNFSVEAQLRTPAGSHLLKFAKVRVLELVES